MTEEAAVRVRDATHADAASVLEIYAPAVATTVVTFEEVAPTEEEMASRIEASHVWLVADTPGGVAGYAYASRFHPRAAYRWSVEVSVYVAEPSQGQGLGRLLVDTLLEALRDRGYVNAFAGISLPNPGSVRLFESFGFSPIALQRKVGFKLGAWHDVGWWQLQLRDPTIPPPPLRPA